jgi:hypothetical protein
MKKLVIFSAFVVLNLCMASCTPDGFVVDDGVTNGQQADDPGGPGGQTGNPPITPPPPPGFGH